MPDQDGRFEHPEQLLVGADRPRPLPPYLRARLEEALTGNSAGVVEVARPLPAEARDKLESSLKPAPTGRPRKWTVLAPALGAAAAVVLALAVGVPALVHGSQTGTNGVSSFNAAAPPAQHTRLSPERSTLGVTPGPANRGIGAKALEPVAGASASRASVGVPSAEAAPPVPVVRSVSPRTGPVSGGNWVVVSGTGLGAVKAVHFGDAVTSRLIVLSTSALKVVAPPHAAGTVEVVVSGGSGQSGASVADRYTYVG
jgi:IPT/TIG domain